MAAAIATWVTLAIEDRGGDTVSDHCDGLYVPSVFAEGSPVPLSPADLSNGAACGTVTHVGRRGTGQRVQTGQHHDGR